jgi:signal transduction histidine kinase
MGEEVFDAELRQMVADIHVASKRLIQIVNDFLDASRLELEKLEVKMERMDVVVLVKRMMEQLRTSADEKGIELVMDMNDEGVYWAMVDVARTEQVVVNVLGNAIKYSQHGVVRVWVEQDEQVVRVKVTDNGIGIAEEDRDKLFQKFRQVGADGYTRNVSQSTGMGLYVTRLLLEKMGGRIYLEWSELNKGSTFSFEVPKAFN